MSAAQRIEFEYRSDAALDGQQPLSSLQLCQTPDRTANAILSNGVLVHGGTAEHVLILADTDTSGMCSSRPIFVENRNYLVALRQRTLEQVFFSKDARCSDCHSGGISG
jgi:hypothetical protein